MMRIRFVHLWNPPGWAVWKPAKHCLIVSFRPVRIEPPRLVRIIAAQSVGACKQLLGSLLKLIIFCHDQPLLRTTGAEWRLLVDHLFLIMSWHKKWRLSPDMTPPFLEHWLHSIEKQKITLRWQTSWAAVTGGVLVHHCSEPLRALVLPTWYHWIGSVQVFYLQGGTATCCWDGDALKRRPLPHRSNSAKKYQQPVITAT